MTKIFYTLRDYKKEYLARDVWSGIMMAAVSIPMAMGYAEVAGLPAVYGLYGSVLPVLLFALFTTSAQFMFGVDAAPAALVGSALTSMGIIAGSPEALHYVPLIVFFSGLWLLLFYALKAGRIVEYISMPVMGGFISGIAVTIILMQVPKFLGSKSGSGELPELLIHLLESFKNVNEVSVLLGVISLALILIAKKKCPKFPMAIVIMIAGVVLTCVFHVDQYGVKLLADVEPGLPKFMIPSIESVDMIQIMGRSLIIAVVIMVETLLSENNYALRNSYQIDVNQEILACAAGNLASAMVGSCPVIGSIPRTSMNEEYGGKTQLVSITAALAMAVLLLAGTDLIGLLPVPVITAIVVSALLNVVEFDLAKRLYRVSRYEFYIFVAAFLGVLILGTIYGVMIGLILSFVAVIMRATNPPRALLGVIPGREGFYDISKNRFAYELEHVVIYQFSENLFFANVKVFQEDIENSIQDDTRVVIVDASSINSIDITAADRLEILAKRLNEKKILFYITEHSSVVNEQMRSLGIGHMIEEGHVRRTITAALHDAGIKEPYPIKGIDEKKRELLNDISAETENSLEEFAWAFGKETVSQIEKYVHYSLKHIHQMPDLEELSKKGPMVERGTWNSLGAIDEDEFLRRMELHMDELPESIKDETTKTTILSMIEKRRQRITEQLKEENPEVLERLKKSREKLEQRLEKQNPEGTKRLHEWEEQLTESSEDKEADIQGNREDNEESDEN